MFAFEEYLEQSWPSRQWRDVTVAVAVSGGPDSVALARALCGNKRGGAGRLIIAHFNHGLRGAESDDEEAFVRQLARQLQLPCHVGRAEEPPSSEAQARQARYAFLAEVARQTGARYLATAHTADDQAETILHRVLRGTGISGLAGIPRTRSLSEMTVLIRPLLHARRSHVIDYLADCRQPFRVDPSNERPVYTRNRIRLELLPELARQYNPHVVDALLRLGDVAREAQLYIQSQVHELADRAIVRQTADVVEINCDSLTDVAPHLLGELFGLVWRRCRWPRRQMGFRQWKELASLACPDAQRQSLCLPSNVRAVREGPLLRLSLHR